MQQHHSTYINVFIVFFSRYCFCHGLDSRATHAMKVIDTEKNRTVVTETVGLLNSYLLLILLANIWLNKTKIQEKVSKYHSHLANTPKPKERTLPSN